MSRYVSGLIVVAALTLTGCSAMEQYHYMPPFSEVPTSVKIAFGEKYPNDAIQLDKTVSQKMFDGSVRYKFTVLNSKNVAREVVFSAEGQEI
jgi:hypothetical protein